MLGSEMLWMTPDRLRARAREGETVGRTLSHAPGVIRAPEGAAAASARTVGGIGAPYDKWTTLVDSPRLLWRERYAAGCFASALRKKPPVDTMSCWNHNPSTVLARLSVGTLRLSDSEEGLRFETDLDPADPDANRVWAKVSNGSAAGSSCWFRVVKMRTDESKDEKGRWIIEETIREATLFEVGAVYDGQYQDATIGVEKALISSVDEYAALRRNLGMV